MKLSLLGSFTLTRDGDSVVLPARKTEALLAVLALKPGVAFEREWLAALLWPDVPEAQARTSLRQAMSHIRRALPASAVAGSADRLHVDPSALSVDTAEVERILARPAAERAAVTDLCRGELLGGFPAVSDPFDRWLSEERTRWTHRIATKMEECLAALAATRLTEQALAVGNFLVEYDATRESVHRALMSLHAERGDRAAALRQYARCREQLARHLDVSPSEATESLKKALSATVAEAPAAPHSSGAEDDRIRLVLFPFEAATEDDLAKAVAVGLTEDLRTELTRFRQLAVISLRPTIERAPPLPARLTFQGSVRVAGDRTRVTASLVDAGTGLTLWAERWESPRDDAFTVLDRLTRSVAGALALKIDEAELARARRTPRERLRAYESWLRGMDCMKAGTPQADEEARAYFQRALESSPDFARAHAGISLSHFNDWSCQAWDRWDLRERLACESAEKAVTLDANDPVPQYILGRIYVYRREYGRGERHLENAVTLNPNDPDALIHAAAGFGQLGRVERAAELSAEALRLNPRSPDWYHAIAGFVEFQRRRMDLAIAVLERAPDCLVDTRAFLAAAYFLTGKPEPARLNLARFHEHFRRKITPLREFEPGEPLKWILHVNPFQRESDADHLVRALVGAGISVAAANAAASP
jgi:DNA-binding SARP family transcriptional activator/Tfp pilus assembly protein PilF